MNKINWLVLGASSAIAKAFMEQAAPDTRCFILVGRDPEDLAVTSNHLQLRYGVSCEVITLDLNQAKDLETIKQRLIEHHHHLGLFIAHTSQYQNQSLTQENISRTIMVNIHATCQIINYFVQFTEKPEAIIYLSSVAGDRGRYKNSLYGASKKSVEIYLEGLKPVLPKLYILCLRLGFIDTPATYGQPGIFLAKTPKQCAHYCYQAYRKKQNRLYFPWFWRYIMLVIKMIPDKLYKQLKF